MITTVEIVLHGREARDVADERSGSLAVRRRHHRNGVAGAAGRVKQF
jgi:hypothetical protein